MSRFPGVQWAVVATAAAYLVAAVVPKFAPANSPTKSLIMGLALIAMGTIAAVIAGASATGIRSRSELTRWDRAARILMLGLAGMADLLLVLMGVMLIEARDVIAN